MLSIFAIISKVLDLVLWLLDYLDKKKVEEGVKAEIENETLRKREADAKEAEATDHDARTADIAVLRDRMRQYERRD